MLDHTRRILLVLAIFIVTGWLYKEWRERHGGPGLFDLLKREPAEKTERTAPISSDPKLSAADVPGLSRLSEESAKLAATVLPAVVSIDTISLGKVNVPFGPFMTQQLGWVPGLGSGVIVSKEGHVITNLHVIKNIAQDQHGKLQIKITTHDG